MAEENDDKTEAPTPHRLEKAREEGQIPRSRELTSLLILIVGVCIIWWGGESLARKLAGLNPETVDLPVSPTRTKYGAEVLVLKQPGATGALDRFR